MTTKHRMEQQRINAAEMDQRRQRQIHNQLVTINRLLLLHKAVQTYLATVEGGVEGWEAYLAHVTAEPCAICGDGMNHYGEPHGEVTGDGKTRADAATAAPTAEEDPTVGSEQHDGEPRTSAFASPTDT